MTEMSSHQGPHKPHTTTPVSQEAGARPDRQHPRRLTRLDPERLRNKWVRMEPFLSEHLDLVDQSGAVEHMWKWMPALPEGGTSFKSYANFVMEETERGYMIPLTLWSAEGNRFIGGAAYVNPNQVHRSVEIGYLWVEQEARGTPAFLASQSLMIAHAKAWRAKRIQWMSNTRNLTGIRALERMGAVREGVMRSACKMANGDWADMAVYAMVGSEIDACLTKIDALLAAID